MSQSNNYISINPFTGEKINEIAVWNEHEIKNSLINSYDAYQSWRKTDLQFRKIFLEKLSGYLKDNKELFAATMTAEMGKPIVQSRAEVVKSASLCDYYHEQLESLQEDRIIQLGEKKYGIIKSQSQGAVLCVMPWNFPLWQVIRCAVPVISGGNVVLLKHAQNVGLTALLIEKAIKEAAGSDHILMSTFVSHDDAGLILQDAHVIGTSLTGSEKAGVSIGKLAGANIKKSVMELGGSDAFVVMKDADFNRSVKNAVKGRLNNNGQTCIAAKRFFIQDDIYQDWVEAFTEEMKKQRVGDPLNENTDVSGLARNDLAETLSKQVRSSVNLGAKKTLSGGIDGKNDSIYHPEVLIDIPVNSALENEETFGPVASIFKFKEEAQMLSMVNNSRFGLGASIWSNDTENAIRLAESIESGSVAVNQMMSSDPRLPFGGIKKSGFGREMSREGYFEFLNLKTIIVGNE